MSTATVQLVIKGKFKDYNLPIEAQHIIARASVRDRVVCPNIKHNQKFDETFVRFHSEEYSWRIIQEMCVEWFCDYERYGAVAPYKEGALLFYSIIRGDV